MKKTTATRDNQESGPSALGAKLTGQSDANKSRPHSAAPCPKTESQAGSAAAPRKVGGRWSWFAGLPPIKLYRNIYAAYAGSVAIDGSGRLLIEAGEDVRGDEYASVMATADELDPKVRRAIADKMIALWNAFAAGGVGKEDIATERKATAIKRAPMRGAMALGPKLPSVRRSTDPSPTA